MLHLKPLTLASLITVFASHPFPAVASATGSKRFTAKPSQPVSLLHLAQAHTSRKAEAERLLEQGIQQYRSNQFAAALQSLQQAFARFRESQDPPGQVKTLRNLGNVHYLLAQYGEAIAYYQQSLELARAIQDREGEAGALGNLGVVAVNQGDYRNADTYYQQALTIYRQSKDRLGEGQTLGNLAEIASVKGDNAGALSYLQQTLAIAHEVKDSQLEANTLGMLGNVYHSLNNYPEAIKYHQQHLELSRRLKNRRGEAAAINNLGNAYFALGDYGKTIEYQEQRLAIARETQDRLGEAQSLKNLSSVYYEVGNFTKAIDYAFKSLAIAEELQSRPLEASVLTTLGNLYLVVQDYPNAIAYHQRRLTLAETMGDTSGAGTALINLGNIYKAMGQYPKAIETHEAALAIARKLQDQALESAALVNLGVEYDDLNQFERAIAAHQQALAIARATKDRASEGLILNNLGNSYFRSGKLAVAETTLAEGLQAWESLRGSLGNDDLNKVTIFDQQARTYRLLQRVLVAQNKPDRALEIAERGRARAFVELLSRRLTGNLSAQQSFTTETPPTIAQIKQIARDQNSTLVQYAITYEDVLVNGKIEGRETALYIWAIAPNGTITFRQVDLKPLRQQKITLSDLISQNREGIGVRGRGLGVIATANNRETGNTNASQLYQLLIQPIAAVLPTDPNARVTFIPQGALFLVPFAALPTPTGKYLIEQHTILTAPSIQVLELTHKQRHSDTSPTRSPVLVVGNPTMPKLPAQFNQPAEALTALPGAEEEAKAIAPILGTRALIGAEASKRVVVQQMPQMQIIHLATHGLLDDFKGLGIPGAIALAPSGNDSGLLTADEILDLKLNAKLVVLSACDTGRGRITGDGVIGLSRSFIAAGVPSLVVSLWAVPDAPTASLMTTFYQTLNRNPDKAQALRQAMLTTMQQYPDPQDWAAFTLIGEAE